MAEKEVAKTLTKEVLKKQIETSQRFLDYAHQQIGALTQNLHKQTGVLEYAKKLLEQFDVPSEGKAEKPDAGV